MDCEIVDLNINPGAIILAAGLGKRLKPVGLKPFLLFKGKSFIEIAFENAKSIQLHPVVIVTNEFFYQKIIALNLCPRILINPHPEQGMLSSILIGLNEIKSSCSGFFLCPIDYPLVQKETFNKLLLAHQAAPDRIIKPSYQKKSGHPIVFPGNLFNDLEKAPLNQDIRFVINQNPHLIRFIDVDDPGVLININTPELYYQHRK